MSGILTLTCEYALRALSLLVREGRGATMLGRDIAEQADIPASYLAKILNTLKRAGMLEATRGAGGGYRIICDPNRVTLMDVAELFEAPRAIHSCILGGGRLCDPANPCAAHGAFGNARETFLAFLETTTIAMISPSGRRSDSSETPHDVDSARRARSAGATAGAGEFAAPASRGNPLNTDSGQRSAEPDRAGTRKGDRSIL